MKNFCCLQVNCFSGARQAQTHSSFFFFFFFFGFFHPAFAPFFRGIFLGGFIFFFFFFSLNIIIFFFFFFFFFFECVSCQTIVPFLIANLISRISGPWLCILFLIMLPQRTTQKLETCRSRAHHDKEDRSRALPISIDNMPTSMCIQFDDHSQTCVTYDILQRRQFSKDMMMKRREHNKDEYKDE